MSNTEQRAFTPGPWQVMVTEHPHHLGGKHVERRICTVWEHPQLKGPWPIVNGSVGIGAKEGSKPVHMVHIDEADARLIAAAPDLYAACVNARDIIATDRQAFVDCQRLRDIRTEEPIAHGLVLVDEDSWLDPDDAEALRDYDRALALIDAALTRATTS